MRKIRYIHFMQQSNEYIKIVLGLKLKKIRQEEKLSLKEVSEKSGISISYLNEIENGKKYPNPKKIMQLAESYKVPYDQLVTLKVNKELAPIAHYLNLEIVNDDLLETFGIEKAALLAILLKDPYKVSAFINAGLEIARNYQLDRDHFYFLCLRAYQELNENYFEEIEEAAEQFRKENFGENVSDVSSALYQHLLEKNRGYNIVKYNFEKISELATLRSVYIPEKKKLLYNAKLTESQKIFLFGRELGFEILSLKKRPYTTSWVEVPSFDHVINNFKASYFAQALHIEKGMLIKDLEYFFSATRFKAKYLINLMQKYNASPEMLMTRITNLLPKYFGINELFFIRYSSKEADKNLKEISKEMQLLKATTNLDYTQKEQSFRREITRIVVRYLNEEMESKEDYKIAAFVSQSPQGNEYLTISILMPLAELDNKNNSVTIGFVLSDALKKKIQFISDAKFQSTEIQQYFDAKRNNAKAIDTNEAKIKRLAAYQVLREKVIKEEAI